MPIRALDYHPDHLARGLRVRRTHTFGVILSNVRSVFCSELFRGIEELARNNGYSAKVCVSNDETLQERHLLSLLFSRRVDGSLLASADPEAAPHWPRGGTCP